MFTHFKNPTHLANATFSGPIALKLNDFLKTAVSTAYLNFYGKPYLTDPTNKDFVYKSSHRHYHGIMHAIGCMELILPLHRLYKKHIRNYTKHFKIIARHFKLSENELISLIQVTALFHDSARENDGVDLWDKQSGENLYIFLVEQHVEHDLAEILKLTIAYKDDALAFDQHTAKLHLKNLDYLRQLVNGADTLEVIRVRNPFRCNFIPINAIPAEHLLRPEELSLDLDELITVTAQRIYCEARGKSQPTVKRVDGTHFEVKYKNLIPMTSMDDAFHLYCLKQQINLPLPKTKDFCVLIYPKNDLKNELAHAFVKHIHLRQALNQEFKVRYSKIYPYPKPMKIDEQDQQIKPEFRSLSEIHLDELLPENKDKQLEEKLNIFFKTIAIRDGNYDDAFRAQILLAIQNEKRYQSQDYLTLYHAVPRNIAILYDFFTALFKGLRLTDHENYTKFRLSELFFKSTPSLSLYLKNKKHTLGDDYAPYFQASFISANPFILGSPRIPGCASYYLFSKNESAELRDFSVVIPFLKHLGIDPSAISSLLRKLYSLLSQVNDAGGVLYQVHIPKAIINDFVYLCDDHSNYYGIPLINLIDDFVNGTLTGEKKRFALYRSQVKIFLHPDGHNQSKVFSYHHYPISSKSYQKTINEAADYIQSTILAAQSWDNLCLNAPLAVKIYNARLKQLLPNPLLHSLVAHLKTKRYSTIGSLIKEDKTLLTHPLTLRAVQRHVAKTHLPGWLSLLMKVDEGNQVIFQLLQVTTLTALDLNNPPLDVFYWNQLKKSFFMIRTKPELIISIYLKTQSLKSMFAIIKNNLDILENEKVRTLLKSSIGSHKVFNRFLENCPPSLQLPLLDLLSDDFSIILSIVLYCEYMLRTLSAENRLKSLLRIYNHLVKIIKDTKDLDDLLEYLNPDESQKIIILLWQYIPNWMVNPTSVNKLFKHLTTEQKTSLLYLIIENPTKFLRSNLNLILEYLPENLRSMIFLVAKHHLSIQSASDFSATLRFLSLNERNIVYHQHKDKLKSILSGKDCYYRGSRIHTLFKYLSESQVE